MPLQRQNEEQIALLKTRLLGRREWFEYGAGLAMSRQHLEGGGALIYDFQATRPALPTYVGDIPWTVNGITFRSWNATSKGGPYCEFDNTNVLYVLDAPWQEVSDPTLGTDQTLLVLHWANTTTAAPTQAIASKYATLANRRSWLLQFSSVSGFFRFSTSALGTAASVVDLDSTRAVSVDTWYMVAGYWEAATRQKVFVGTATDKSLTIDQLTVGVPASLYDDIAPLAIGAAFSNPAPPTFALPWNGGIGRGKLLFGIPSANIDGFVSRIFHQTKHYYP